MALAVSERLLAERHAHTANSGGASTSSAVQPPMLAQLYAASGTGIDLPLGTRQQPRRRMLRFILGPLMKLRQRGEGDSPAGSSEDGDVHSAALLDEAAELQAQLAAMSCEASTGQEQWQELQQRQQVLEQQIQQQLQQQGQGQQRQRGTGRLKGLAKQLLRAVLRSARVVGQHISPQGPGINDGTLAERLLNVVTSLPFMAIGVQALRTRKSGVGKHFGASFMVVGAVAAVYHAVQGPVRPYLRKMDYYAIAYSTSILRRAAHVPLPRIVTVLCTLATPIKPTAVTLLNMLLVEGQYAKAVLGNRHLLRTWGWHLAASLIGGATFAAEDVAIAQEWPPVFHAAWHCLSAAAMGTATCGLLNHLELVQA